MKKFVFFAFFLLLIVPLSVFAEANEYDLKISGYLKGLYHFQHNGVEASTDTFSVGKAVIEGECIFRDYISVVVELDLKENQLYDAYLKGVLYNDYGMKFGQFKVPFGIELFKKESQTNFINHPYGLKKLFFEYYEGRDIGLLAYGRTKYFLADAAYVNGSGWESSDDDKKKTSAGRMLFCMKGVEFGGSFYQGSYFDAYSRDVNRLGANIALKNGGDSLEFEYYYGKDDRQKKYGWYVQGGMGLPFVSPQAYYYIPVRGVFRIEYWDPDKTMGKDEISIFTFGLNYSPVDFLKVQLNYEHHTEDPKIKNDHLLAQVQVAF